MSKRLDTFRTFLVKLKEGYDTSRLSSREQGKNKIAWERLWKFFPCAQGLYDFQVLATLPENSDGMNWKIYVFTSPTGAPIAEFYAYKMHEKPEEATYQTLTNFLDNNPFLIFKGRVITVYQ